MRLPTRISVLSALCVCAAAFALFAVGSTAVSAAPTSVSAAGPVTALAPPPDITPVKVAATRIAEGHAVYVRGIDHRLFWRTNSYGS